MMSHLRHNNEEYEDDDDDDRIFQNTFPCSQDSKDAFKEYYSLGSMKSKLLFTSKNIREDTKHGYDPISKFVLNKMSFICNLNCKKGTIAKGPVSSYLERLEKHIRTSSKDHYLKMRTDTTRLMKFALSDPDPYFFGHYNWYYTGGTLQSVCNEDGYLLLFVERGKKYNLCVVPLESDGSWRMDNNRIIRATPSDGKEIFQVLGKKNSPLIGVRQKNACTVFSHLGNDDCLQKCFETNSEEPFTSFDISPVRNELCTINCDFTLTFWDLAEKNIPVFNPFSSDNMPHDKWHSLWYSKSSPFDLVVATRSSLRWYDRRNSCLANSIELSCISGAEEDEEISVHFESQCYSNAIYIGTNVSLLLMDARMLETAVHRWSHRMTNPPLYSAVVSPSNGKEVACIANHYPGDAVLAFSTPDHSYPLVELPSKIESLLMHQAQGQFLDPSLKPRLAPALSGVTAVSTSGSLDTSVFTQIHTSEIFSHSLFHSDEEADFCLLKAGKETLHASERWDMSKMYESLSNINQKSVKCPILSSPETTKQEWQWDIKDLKKYKDALSTIILEEWDDDIEETEKESLNREKVTAWLHQQYNTTSQEDVVCDEDEF